MAAVILPFMQLFFVGRNEKSILYTTLATLELFCRPELLKYYLLLSETLLNISLSHNRHTITSQDFILF